MILDHLYMKMILFALLLLLLVIAVSFVIIPLLRRIRFKSIEMMPNDDEIEHLSQLSENERSRFQIDSGYSFVDKPMIQRALTDKEYELINKKRYGKKDGWQLSRYAYLLENKCPCCGDNLFLVYHFSPSWTWKKLCGRAGFLVFCPKCKKDLMFLLTKMN